MEFDTKIDTIYIDENQDNINLKEIIEKYSYHWKWFLLGIILAVGCAFIYLRYTPNQYQVSATIYIDDKDSGGLTSELSAFEDLGGLGKSKASIINETGVLKSRTLVDSI